MLKKGSFSRLAGVKTTKQCSLGQVSGPQSPHLEGLFHLTRPNTCCFSSACKKISPHRTLNGAPSVLSQNQATQRGGPTRGEPKGNAQRHALWIHRHRSACQQGHPPGACRACLSLAQGLKGEENIAGIAPKGLLRALRMGLQGGPDVGPTGVL